jgi:hypothetical protein
MSDVRILPQGTLIGFTPLTPQAHKFFQAYVQSEDWQWLGCTLWCDRRPAEQLAIVLIADGLDVEVQR